MKSNFVGLHPYFRAHPRKIEAVKSVFPQFIEKTATEKKNLFYGLSVNGDEMLRRAAYENADGLLAHLENVAALLSDMLK